VGAGPTPCTFSLPAGDNVSTGFAYDAKANAIWFGTYNGTLYCLDTNLNTVNHTPFTPAPPVPDAPAIFTAPVIYNGTQGNATVLFGVTTQQDLLGFDPTSGNVVAVPTGATRVYALSKSVTNGVIYIGGSNSGATAPGQYPQVFGIRVDQLPQAERAFIIESELMQDPDPNATGTGNIPSTGPLPANPIPPSVARYQTHLTVVDDQKTARPNETVKIWADIANTVITIGGQQYTIGPDDAAFATVTTGVDGCVVIVSDAPNINSSALRVGRASWTRSSASWSIPITSGMAARAAATPTLPPTPTVPTRRSLTSVQLIDMTARNCFRMTRRARARQPTSPTQWPR
jgi:hypothetical protein